MEIIRAKKLKNERDIKKNRLKNKNEMSVWGGGYVLYHSSSGLYRNDLLEVECCCFKVDLWQL